MLCRYYYPKCTLAEVKDLLYEELIEENGDIKLRSSYCYGTDRRMFYLASDAQPRGFVDLEKECEFKQTPNWWKNI